MNKNLRPINPVLASALADLDEAIRLARSTARRTELPLCSNCFGFFSPDDPCCVAPPAVDVVHVTEWAADGSIVRQYDAPPARTARTAR